VTPVRSSADSRLRSSRYGDHPALYFLKYNAAIISAQHGDCSLKHSNFSNSWSDGRKQSHWRKAVVTRDPATRPKGARPTYTWHLWRQIVQWLLRDRMLKMISCRLVGALCSSPRRSNARMPRRTSRFLLRRCGLRELGERFREGAIKGEKSWALKREGRLRKSCS
jgi:hypothetical protein